MSKKNERFYHVVYRDEFGALIKAPSPQEAIEIFEKTSPSGLEIPEGVILPTGRGLHRDFFEVYDEELRLVYGWGSEGENDGEK